MGGRRRRRQTDLHHGSRSTISTQILFEAQAHLAILWRKAWGVKYFAWSRRVERMGHLRWAHKLTTWRGPRDRNCIQCKT
eukprot:5056370-Lingulodinium_polyedra.AAC.1